jgi:tetratricopeptide (TPR) repeat protein
LSSAGRRAFARGDAPAAANLFRRATSTLPTESPWRVELLSPLADAHTEQGDFAEATAILEEGAAISTRLADPRLQARIRLTQMIVEFGTGAIAGVDRAVAEGETLARTLEAAGDQSGVARAWRLLMVLHGTAGHYELASDAATRLIDAATGSGETRLIGSGIANYSVCALHGPTAVDEALERCVRLLDAVRDDRKAESVVLSVLSVLYAMNGDAVQAHEAAARSRADLADLGMSVTGASTTIETSRVDMLVGDPAAAEQDLRRDHDVLAAVGESYARSSLAGLLAHALWALGRYDEADRYASIAEELADPDDVDSQVIWRSVKAKLLARRDDAARAIELAESARAMAATTDDIDRQADVLRDLAEVYALIGDEQAEGPALRQALELYERKGNRAQAGRIRLRLTEASPA